MVGLVNHIIDHSVQINNQGDASIKATREDSSNNEPRVKSNEDECQLTKTMYPGDTQPAESTARCTIPSLKEMDEERSPENKLVPQSNPIEKATSNGDTKLPQSLSHKVIDPCKQGSAPQRKAKLILSRQ